MTRVRSEDDEGEDGDTTVTDYYSEDDDEGEDDI